jgi:hypothetical protein
MVKRVRGSSLGLRAIILPDRDVVRLVGQDEAGGRIAEFAMASGEMTDAEFLTSTMPP